MGTLNSSEVKQLHQTILNSFPLSDFDRCLQFHCDGIKRQHISIAGDLSAIVFDVIEWFEQRDQTPQLIAALKTEPP